VKRVTRQVLTGRDAAGSRACGAFVGISTPDYSDLKKALAPLGVYSATGSALSVAAGRLSFTFGLRGPAVAIDTACSSALVATHLALGALRAQECELGLAAGVKLILTPALGAMFQIAGMLSSDGRCKTLDAAADGYVRGEAGAAILLSGMGRGSTAGDAGQGMAPLAVLAGSAVNQDGRSSALTAPNGPAQQEVIQAALHAAGVDAGAVTALQMHGTGTPLGDPIELGAALEVLGAKGGNRGPLILASDKSSWGHTEPAAGLMGVLQASRSSAEQVTQPILHLISPNPHARALLEQSDPGCKALLPRALGAGQSREQGHSGISSFAFQVRLYLARDRCCLGRSSLLSRCDVLMSHCRVPMRTRS
jgi:acyl transferase domain-containing protein